MAEPAYKVVSARVVSYNRKTQHVIARPVSIGGTECPAIWGVPVVFPTTGAHVITHELRPGDPLLLVYHDDPIARDRGLDPDLIAIPGVSL